MRLDQEVKLSDQRNIIRCFTSLFLLTQIIKWLSGDWRDPMSTAADPTSLGPTKYKKFRRAGLLSWIEKIPPDGTLHNRNYSCTFNYKRLTVNSVILVG